MKLAILLAAIGTAQAHHSFGATYDVAKETTLKGTIVQISLRSPHSFFYVEVASGKDEPARWSIEGASAAQFAQQGITRDAFKVGDVVEVVYNPARSETSLRGRLVKIVRPTDGRSWGNRLGETVN